MNLAEWVRAGHARDCANATDNSTKYVEERAVDTMLDTSDTHVLSVTRLEEVSTNCSASARARARAGRGTDLHLVLAKRLDMDNRVNLVNLVVPLWNTNTRWNVLCYAWGEVIDDV